MKIKVEGLKELAHFIRRSFSCAWKDGDEAVGFA
jgi:hypothetical protein